MIVFKPYKYPTKKLFLRGRFRKMRRLDGKSTRALQHWMKRRDKWK